jgi:threonine dehydratase
MVEFTQEPTFEDVLEAAKFLNGKINRTQMDSSETIGKKFGGLVYFKLENLQKTGSFKIRGALFKISKLTTEEKKAGVVAASAGNHAQGVALASRTSGINCKIVMPKYTTPAKISAVERYGAQVDLFGSDYAEARDHSLKLAIEENRTFIEGFNDRWIIAGQGTIGLEIMEDIPDADLVIVPVGGGGLISGIAMTVKAINPKVTIIGVQSEKYDSARASVEAGIIVEHVSDETIADGIAIRRPGEITFSMMQKYVDRIITVSDETIALALYHLLEHNKILVEPAGAAGLAAILGGKIDISGKKVVVVLSGGNINLLLLSKIIYKSLEHESRLIRIGFKIPDRPGTLYRIASAISEAGGNIYHAEVDNLDESTPIGFQSITFTVNVQDSKHAAQLLEKVKSVGYKFDVLE